MTGKETFGIEPIPESNWYRAEDVEKLFEIIRIQWEALERYAGFETPDPDYIDHATVALNAVQGILKDPVK